jgi:predicted RND superfamily exporter protein
VSRRFADVVYRARFVLSLILLAGAAAFIPKANITAIDNDVTAWFSQSDPVYQDYDRFRREFGGTRTLIVALRADSAERLFSRETLAFIQQISSDIELVQTVERVASLATATLVHAIDNEEDGGLDVRPLLEDLAERSPGEIRRAALSDELIRGDLVSDDGTVTAIVVSFDEDRIDEVRAGVIQQIHDIVDPSLPAGVEAFYNGSLEISETYNRVTLDNQRRFTPPILLITIIFIYATFRSVRKTAVTMVAVGVSVLWTLGLYDLMGFTYNILTSMLIPLVVVLAVTDDVHIMQRWDEERRRGSAEQAFKATVAHLAKPIFGASTTTALGLLSLATSDVLAVKSFGAGAAMGVMVDFAVSITLMPTMLSLLRPEPAMAPNERYLTGPLRRVAAISSTYPGRVAAAAAVVTAIAVAGIFQLKVDTNHINFFSANHPLGESARVIDGSLSGVYSFEIMLEGPPDSLNTPDALQRMDRLQAQLRRFPHVKKVTSVADYVKRIHKELNDGREEAYVVPADQATISQELFVFALGGEGRHELERVVASDYSRARITVKTQSMSSELVLDQVEEADRLARAAFEGTGISVLTTGSGRLFGTLDRYLVDSQLSSFGTAFLTVFAVIFLIFRSARFGLLAVPPNLIPVVIVLGVMGLLGISLNIATVMVASLALGIVDDDTIHFINRYRREVAEGRTSDAAIETATTHEGRAALTSAVINSAGYSVLLFTEYKPTAWFGGLLALTMLVAFLAQVFILPASIKLLPRFFGHDRIGPGARRAAAAALVLAVAFWAAPDASAQAPNGKVSVFAGYYPHRDDAAEIRARAFAERVFTPSADVRIRLAGFAEGLLAKRPGLADTNVAEGILRADEAVIVYARDRFAVDGGFGRIVWGRLDELQPTDVINPIDVSRFLLEGRSEARLPVGYARARAFFGERATFEGIYVPFFRQGRFDQLGEDTSPFNTGVAAADAVVCQAIGCPPSPVVTARYPARTLRNGQGGARLSVTTGRLDWSVSAWRGIEPFGVASVANAREPLGLSFVALERSFPRYTMIGGDFETVRGEWGLRGEVAAFVDDTFQGPGFTVVDGRSVDAGIAVDRRAGTYRVGGAVIVHHEAYGEATQLPPQPPGVPGPSGTGRTDVSLTLSVDRTFARERYRARAFAVSTPAEGTGLVRGILTATLRDDLALEASGGWFAGSGRDTIGRFGDSDFIYTRLTVYF